MTLFYRGPGAIITHEVFESRHPLRRRYAVRELTHVHVARPSTLEKVGRSVPLRVCSEGSAGLAALTAVLGPSVLHDANVSVVATVVLVMAGGVSAIAHRLRCRPLELWAIYRTDLVLLYEDQDVRVFRQVTRAMLRVLELIQDEHRDGEPT